MIHKVSIKPLLPPFEAFSVKEHKVAIKVLSPSFVIHKVAIKVLSSLCVMWQQNPLSPSFEFHLL